VLTLLSDIEPELNQVDQWLVNFFPEIDKNFQPFFINLLSGGKRLRPALVILFHNLGAQSVEPRVYNLAGVTELVHVASLLHDDVMDAVFLRRGLKLADLERHNKLSVIIADMILSKALTELTSLNDSGYLNIICRTSYVMSLGQLKETAHLEDMNLSEDDYFYIIEAKTARLFASCCEIGAKSGGFDTKICSLAREFGLNLGLAFQLQDDILDYWGEEGKLGKPVGNDFHEKKLTLPLIWAFQRAKGKDFEKLVKIFSNKENNADEFAWILDLFLKLGIKDSIDQKAVEYSDKAIQLLENFPENKNRLILKKISDYIIKREK